MNSITFKLKSSNHIGIIDMESSVIKCSEAIEAIASKISAAPEELKVSLAGNSAFLHPEEYITAFAVLEVVRGSAAGKPITRKPTKPNDGAAKTMAKTALSSSQVPTSELTEDERIKQLQADVERETGVLEVAVRGRGRGRGGGLGFGGRGGRGGPGGAPGMNREDSFKPPPPNYVCHNCGKGGHFIEHCPNRNERNLRFLSKPTGIPESLLVECTMDDPAPKFITRDGKIVKRRVDSSVIAEVAALQKNCDGGNEEGNEEDILTSTKPDVPEHLKCVVDHVLAVAAMKTPCCSKLICDHCFQEMTERAFEAEEPPKCPDCGEAMIVDEVVPAEEQRREIEAFKSNRKRPRDSQA